MLGVDERRLAGIGLPFHGVFPPGIATGSHRHLAARALVDEHVLDRLAAAHAECLVHHGFERDLAAAAELPVRGNDRNCPGVDDALLNAFGGEAAEHDRMGRADPRAGLHRHHCLDRHRHVDQHAVALLDAPRLERVGELAHFPVQVAVADLGHLAVVGLENDRDLVGLRLQVPVEAVVGSVQLAVVEPAEERRFRLVERLREGLGPEQRLARKPRPEALEVFLGLADELAVSLHAGDVGLLDEVGLRWKDAFLDEHRLDV